MQEREDRRDRGLGHSFGEWDLWKYVGDVWAWSEGRGGSRMGRDSPDEEPPDVAGCSEEEGLSSEENELISTGIDVVRASSIYVEAMRMIAAVRIGLARKEGSEEHYIPYISALSHNQYEK